ncbi:hypothetical protein F5876DRAFT_78235 [Lentinula aff. lateritia]|uniref:Uncharacterized protein n=1 Tax=Lentinula aff. lateritia TaxID=2804960 RepID=A0ACC1TW68_9AGAR|nr:hypothetical protein F5876DRAFT_78235 [Lentinula aff. lateritia]
MKRLRQQPLVTLEKGTRTKKGWTSYGSTGWCTSKLSFPSPKPDTAQALHYDEALRQRDIVVDILGCSYLELAYAHPRQIAEYNAPNISPSSNESRPGNPLEASLDEPLPTNCRFYNHLGCRRRKKCFFSHAPDARSIRDDLLGKERLSTVYIISSENANGIRSLAFILTPKITFHPTLIEKRDARRKKIHEQIEHAKKRNIENNQKSKKKRDNNPNNKRPGHSSSSSNSNCDEMLVIDWESDSESEGELQFEDVESPNLDLLSYGNKPWEHEEAKALAVALDNLHT